MVEEKVGDLLLGVGYCLWYTLHASSKIPWSLLILST